MLKAGFSLIEMLLAIILTSILMIVIMAFYPKMQVDSLIFYQQYRLEESVNQVLSGLIKDIKRAGFIANQLTNLTKSPIVISNDKQCIMIRYDLYRRGEWREDKYNKNDSDIFVYRYYQKNIVYRLGIPNCKGQDWERLFDSNEIEVTRFKILFYSHFVAIDLSVRLKSNNFITYSTTHYVKTENI